MSTQGSNRSGFSLIELLIALTLALVVGAMTTLFLLHQHRFTHGVTEVVSTQDRLHDAVNVLVADLRAAPASALRDATDTSITFFSLVGSSVLCTDPAGVHVTLVPDTLATNQTLSAWVATPDSGDVVLLYHDTSAVSPAAGWLRYHIAQVSDRSVATACPPSTGFTTPDDASHSATTYDFTLDASPPLSITSGTPVRVMRLVRYSIYRASDRSWYLGYHLCNDLDNTCSTIQPVSGPYTQEATPPLTFRYYSDQGSEISDLGPGALPSIARVDIDLHGAAHHHVVIPGLVPAYRDSVLATVSFRNQD
jgi:prepilin-type N-terminal cleavage/methylation domain-containing protein